jgi:hypothetical protein
MSVVTRGLVWPATRRRPRDLIGDESEEHFLSRVRRTAKLFGWVDWHQRDSIGTRPGLPDLILVRPPRVIFAELKSQHGVLRVAQKVSIGLLAQCPGVEAYVLRPSDWSRIVEVLR